MSESDTMFNKRDRRCAAVQLMLSTDPSYDNRTIASTLKMQIQTVQRAQGDKNKVSGYGYDLWCGFKWRPYHATSHLQSWLESQHQSVLGCAEECGNPLVQSGGQWQTLGVASLIAVIRRAPTGACGKGMLLVPDPYRGSDWGWRRLYWIRYQLYYIIKLAELIFSIKVLK